MFVVLGVAGHLRDSYKLWEEPKGPDFVLELASPSTWQRDLGEKRLLYQSLGVAEYVVCDPRGEVLSDEPLRGFRLHHGVYVPIATTRRNEAQNLRSETLGVVFRARGAELRLCDRRGRELPTHLEAVLQRDQEAARRRVAEARVAELEALLSGRRDETT